MVRVAVSSVLVAVVMGNFVRVFQLNTYIRTSNVNERYGDDKQTLEYCAHVMAGTIRE